MYRYYETKYQTLFLKNLNIRLTVLVFPFCAAVISAPP